MAFALLELFNPWVDNSGTEGYEKKSKDGLAPSQILIGNLTHTESNYLTEGDWVILNICGAQIFFVPFYDLI